MNIQGLNIANSLLNFTSGELREGQRLFVEVLRLDSTGQGVVNIKGNLLEAVLETTTQPGDKFWAVVKEVKTQELVLARENKTPGSSGNILLSREQAEPNPDLAQALNTAKDLDWNTLLKPSLALASKPLTGFTEQLTSGLADKLSPGLTEQSTAGMAEKLLSILPHWAELNGDNGPTQIRDFLNKLGIGYERKLAELLLSKDKPPEEELARLKDTIKAQLLKGMNDKGDNSLNSNVQGLLDKITGMQLFLGNLNDSYIWFSLPLSENQQVVDAKIALQSDRQKSALDSTHCRIGVYLETQALGRIGVDAYLSEDALSLRVLTTSPQEISFLLEEFKEETIARFAHLGLRLTGIDVAPLDLNPEFKGFVSGEPRQGVDTYA